MAAGFAAATDAVTQGFALLEAGADILDIGGESRDLVQVRSIRPRRSAASSPSCARLRMRGAVVSIDTRHAATMHAGRWQPAPASSTT